MHNPLYELSRTHFCSTLAIWPRSKPYRLDALPRPSGIFAGRSGTPTRKKSPYIPREPAESSGLEGSSHSL
jgi:hypothetical protein